MTVGERIKAIRKSKHMTQHELADKIGVKRSAVHKYEKNLVSISVEKLNNIANIFGVDICYFFGKEEKHAKWNINCDGYYPYCSNCKTEPPSRIMTKHCPNCGARMDLKE